MKEIENSFAKKSEDFIMARHTQAAQKALKLKDLEKIGKSNILSGGFKSVAPIIKKKSKIKRLKEFLNSEIKH